MSIGANEKTRTDSLRTKRFPGESAADRAARDWTTKLDYGS